MKKRAWKSGEAHVWLAGSMLAASLVLVLGLFLLILLNGLGFFWPRDVVRLKVEGGTSLIGEILEREKVPETDSYRLRLKQGNRELSGQDVVWVDERVIRSRSYERGLVVVERLEWGNMYGKAIFLRAGSNTVYADDPGFWAELDRQLTAERRIMDEIHAIERGAMGLLSAEIENLRLQLRVLGDQGQGDAAAAEEAAEERERLVRVYQQQESSVAELRQRLKAEFRLEVADGQMVDVPLPNIVRIVRPNEMTYAGKSRHYLTKLGEFIFGEPRESNTEGGVFPALFGTILLVMLMSMFAAPLGVLTAVYLREYSTQGRIVSLVRIGVNNLAGVPSIVFGVFGLGFFIYVVGGNIDSLFFHQKLPTPTFGTGGILWASLTLALLTIPTVIVATEEGLALLPRSLREASYALGATKCETTFLVVLPALAPSILTGMMLATARAAGEVAPLMITGVVKLAPSLPIDSAWPFLHLDRKFMHLGFHIYDVGFQSPNVEAVRPMVYATTLLLLAIVVVLNLAALIVRNRLRRRFASAMA